MKTFGKKAAKTRWFRKKKTTAWFISVVIGFSSTRISMLFLDDSLLPVANVLGIGVFSILNYLFLKKPELMGKLYKPDDGEKDEDA